WEPGRRLPPGPAWRRPRPDPRRGGRRVRGPRQGDGRCRPGPPAGPRRGHGRRPVRGYPRLPGWAAPRPGRGRAPRPPPVPPALRVRDLKREDADALTWLREWDGRNAVPKGEARLRELIQSAHAYGKHGYGSGLSAAVPGKNRHAHSTISFTMEVR